MSIYAEFSGKSTGVRMADDGHYYSVYIDGKLPRVFHGNRSEAADYTLADSLQDGWHTLLLTKRNCAQFDGFEGGNVANGHPTVATHEKIAAQLIAAIQQHKAFE